MSSLEEKIKILFPTDIQQRYLDELFRRDAEFAAAMRLVAKTIHQLQRIGAQRQADELLAEASELGFDITIMPDSTAERN